MSYTYLQEQGAESLAESFSDIPPFALSKSSPIAEKSCCNGSETGSCLDSQSGTMCEHSMARLGEKLQMSSAVDSRAKDSVRQRGVETMRLTCGRKCSALWETCAHGLFSARTSAKMRSSRLKQILPHVAIKRRDSGWMRKTWAQTILGNDFGYLPTPTATANWDSPSMAKWPCCRNAQLLFGKVSPTSQEWLMGWPEKWTDVEPLETGKFQRWLQQHGNFSRGE